MFIGKNMNFKIFFEESNTTTVFHVSPKSNIYRFRPIGHSKGVRAYIGKNQPGIYVTPKFKYALAWAVSYVSGKKGETQEPNKRLREKGEGGGVHGEKGPLRYKSLTIYELKIPKEILKISPYETFWEPEYFISSDNLKFLDIVKSTTYSTIDLLKMYNRSSNASFQPDEKSIIKKISKTNTAARYYLELLSLYNNAVLSGVYTPKTADSDHFLNREINKFRDYIFQRKGFKVEPIIKLSATQDVEVENLYDSIKKIINNLPKASR